MPERNPFEETMRAGMNVPQRTVRPTMRDVAGPARETSTYPHEAAHLNMGDRAYNRPGFKRPMTNVPVGSPNIGRDRMGGIFGGQRASGASDMVNAMMGGMETSRLQREDELGGVQEPGVEYAQYTDPATKMKGPLWRQANVNVNPEGITPLPEIVKEWERLKQEYWNLKAQGYTPGND